MSHSDDSLADDAQSLLAAYRAEEGVPVDVRARVLARIDRTVAAPAAADVAPVAGRGVRWSVVGIALAAAVAAVWWGRELMTPTPVIAPSSAGFDHVPATTEGTDERSTDEHTVAPTPATVPATVPPTTPRVEAPAATEVIAPTTSPASSTTRQRTPSIEIDAFADETELLRAAQSARARGDSKAALALLDAGARRFGSGALAEERAALHVLALCDLGRRTRARREADAFATSYPSSPLLGRVRNACVEESSRTP